MNLLRAGFTGYYGMNNFGDDLFGALCAAAARGYWNAEPLLVGPVLDGVQARYTMPPSFPAAWYGGSGAVGKASRLLSFCRGLRGSDVLVLGGGSVITARQSFRKPLMLSAQRRGKVQLAAVGVSIDPFESARSEAEVADFMSRFTYLAVRDRRSYRLAASIGLADITHQGRDLAGLLPLLAATPVRTPRAAEAPYRIGIAPCNYTQGRDYPAPSWSSLQAPLLDALTALAGARALQVEVFSLNEHPLHGDSVLADELHARLQARGVRAQRWRYARQGPWGAVEAIANCDAMISARLHGAIVAYMLGVPFMIIDYHPKCRDFADDIGLAPARCLDAAGQDPSGFMDVLATMLDGDTATTVPRGVYALQTLETFTCAPWAMTATSR